MKHPIRSIVMLVALIVAVLPTVTVVAQPLGGRVLQDVEIKDRCIVVGFSFPVQYLRHFPRSTGNEVRIFIRPRAVGRIDGDALAGREAMRPPGRQAVHLSEAIYDGDALGGPSVLLLFDRPVTFQVGIGTDFRSIVVFVGENGSDAACFPK